MDGSSSQLRNGTAKIMDFEGVEEQMGIVCDIVLSFPIAFDRI
jgi:hypothetical protein